MKKYPSLKPVIWGALIGAAAIFGDRLLILGMDARRHCRANGERASASRGGCRTRADLRREIPASGRCGSEIDRVQKDLLVGSPIARRALVRFHSAARCHRKAICSSTLLSVWPLKAYPPRLLR